MKHNTPAIRPPCPLGRGQHLVLALLLLLAWAPVVHAQFNYTTNNGAITITGYTGPGGAVVIPDTITGLPVIGIGNNAFQFTSLTSVTIPNSVTSIGVGVFNSCASLTNVTIGNGVTNISDFGFYACTSLTSVAIPNSVASIGGLAFSACSGLTNVAIPNSVSSIGDQAFSECTSLASVTIPNSVTSIGAGAFGACSSLTNVTIPHSVTSLGDQAFSECSRLVSVTIPNGVSSIGDFTFYLCPNLKSVNFQGDAPSLGGPNVFFDDNDAVIYYLPGTTGWGSILGGRPTAPWLLPNPLILSHAPSFGVQTNAFGFRVSWATNISVVVEACTDLGAPVWSPVSTNTLVSGWAYFSDSQWTNYPSRVYRVRSQ
jgi:hypothetical protein